VTRRDHPSYRADFAIDPRYAAVLRLFGVRRERAWIGLDGERLRVRFGFWRFETSVANIDCVRLTGPYRSALRAVGPHISLKDRGLSFGTNTEAGVCILFRRPVPGRETLGLIDHPGLTVTPVRPEDVKDALEAARDAAER
jgi:hypothetical protein